MMKTVDIGRQARDQTGICHFVSKIDGARKSKGVGPAVALHRNPVKSQKSAAVNPARVHFLLQNPETTLREKRAELTHHRTRHRGPEVSTNLARRPLGGLQRDVAGEAFDHDDIDRALRVQGAW